MKSQQKKLTCSECKNTFSVPDSVKVEDILECEFCGIEYEVKSVDDKGEVDIEIAEEEK